MKRVMVFDAGPGRADVKRVVAALDRPELSVTAFGDGTTFLDAAVSDPPDVIVFLLGRNRTDDVAMLRLLRRAQPALGLILLARDESLETRTALQAVRPMFYAVGLSDLAEVVEAVASALKLPDRAPPPRSP